MDRSYSFVIPVYNRPEEIEELLQSMVKLQGDIPFELVIVEDGSTKDCKQVVARFEDSLNISYYFKANSGPGDSRNYGMRVAKGNYFIILDSDCLLPAHYLQSVDTYLSKQYVDCFGGADDAHQGRLVPHDQHLQLGGGVPRALAHLQHQLVDDVGEDEHGAGDGDHALAVGQAACNEC